MCAICSIDIDVIVLVLVMLTKPSVMSTEIDNYIL